MTNCRCALSQFILINVITQVWIQKSLHWLMMWILMEYSNLLAERMEFSYLCYFYSCYSLLIIINHHTILNFLLESSNSFTSRHIKFHHRTSNDKKTITMLIVSQHYTEDRHPVFPIHSLSLINLGVIKFIVISKSHGLIILKPHT